MRRRRIRRPLEPWYCALCMRYLVHSSRCPMYSGGAGE